MCLKATKPIGYQVENEVAECFDHTSFEIIENFEEAKKIKSIADSEEPSSTWTIKPIYEGYIEKYTLI